MLFVAHSPMIYRAAFEPIGRIRRIDRSHHLHLLRRLCRCRRMSQHPTDGFTNHQFVAKMRSSVAGRPRAARSLADDSPGPAAHPVVEPGCGFLTNILEPSARCGRIPDPVPRAFSVCDFPHAVETFERPLMSLRPLFVTFASFCSILVCTGLNKPFNTTPALKPQDCRSVRGCLIPGKGPRRACGSSLASQSSDRARWAWRGRRLLRFEAARLILDPEFPANPFAR